MDSIKEQLLFPPQSSIAKRHFGCPGRLPKGFNILSGNSNTTDALPQNNTFEEDDTLGALTFRFELAYTYTRWFPPYGLADPTGGITFSLQTINYTVLGGIVSPGSIAVGANFTSKMFMHGSSPDYYYEDSFGNAPGYLGGGWNDNNAGITYMRLRCLAYINTVSGTYLDPNELTVIYGQVKLTTQRVPGSGTTVLFSNLYIYLATPIIDFCRVVTEKNPEGGIVNTYDSASSVYSSVGFAPTDWTTQFNGNEAGAWDNGIGGINRVSRTLPSAADTTWLSSAMSPL